VVDSNRAWGSNNVPVYVDPNSGELPEDLGKYAYIGPTKEYCKEKQNQLDQTYYVQVFKKP